MKFSLYGGFTQVVIVGFLAFCGPGLFNAMNGLGGAGNENTDYANAANATLYATFAVFGYFGGAAFNLLGNKILMAVGGLTYAIYAATQYMAANIKALGWISPVGGAILGFGAGWFWTAQGAMMLAYSTPSSRGRYIATFWVIFNLGGMLGGFLTFAVNFNTTVATANAATYFIFIGLMCAGSALSIFLLVPPSKVKREDEEMVEFEKASGWQEEVKGAIAVACDTNMALLLILFISSNWFYTYQFNGVNGQLFTIRTRGFNSALYWGAQMLGSVMISWVLDNKKWSVKKRGVLGLIFVLVQFNFVHAIGAYLQMGYEGAGYDKNREIGDNLIDFTHGSRYWFPFVTFLLYGLGDALIQTLAYWVMAALAKSDTNLCARYAGFYKGTQSAGAAVAWGLDLSPNVTYTVQFWICWGLFLAAMVGAGVCVSKLEEVDEEDPKAVSYSSPEEPSEKVTPEVVSGDVSYSSRSSRN